MPRATTSGPLSAAARAVFGLSPSRCRPTPSAKISIVVLENLHENYGDYRVASVLTMPVNVATAQSGTSSDTGNAASPNELAEVIVTGTRRQDRTVAESSAPIDVLTGAELASYPAANMLDTLSNLVPSFIVGQNSISDASSFVRSPSLRGLPAVRCW
jgi:iron complex outermembrane receptor protein